MKALFFDIDGTLVSFKTHEIPTSTKQVLKQLKDKGHRLFIATGRGPGGLSVLDGFGVPAQPATTKHDNKAMNIRLIFFINSFRPFNYI